MNTRPLKLAQKGGKAKLTLKEVLAMGNTYNKPITPSIGSTAKDFDLSERDATKYAQQKAEQERIANIVTLNKEKEARRAKEEGAYTTLPDGSTKLYKDMDFREKGYVNGQSLRNKSRWDENSPEPTSWYNPAAFLYGTAANLAEAPYVAKQTDSYMPYITSVGLPLVLGRAVGSGSINPFSKGFYTNTIPTKQFVNNLVNPLAGVGDLVNNLGNKYLPNAYKLNPNAFKPNPNNFYRQVDTPTFNEGLESGLIRGKQDIGYSDESAMKMFGDDAYYNKGRLYYKNEKDYPYLFEANLPEDRFIPKVNGRTRKYTTENTRVRVSKEPLPINDPNIKTYKKDWLKGYKPIEIPKSNFKSEINWRQWNKEIPDNPQLMQEYNTIEQTSKANGSWMKNPDGSDFKGTPEQFVQQNSENFKKAFGNSKLINPDGSAAFQYHGGKRGYEQFLRPQDKGYIKRDTYTGDQGIYFTPSKLRANNYSKNTPKNEREVYQTYINMEKPYSGRVKGTYGNDHITNEQFNELLKNNYDGVIDKNIFPFHRQTIVFDPKKIKSAIGNNGMFDMTNPNIYKALVPAVGAVALSQKQQGGIAVDSLGYYNPKNPKNQPILIPSNSITMKDQKGKKKLPNKLWAFPNGDAPVLMEKGNDYFFPNSTQVLEQPFMQKGGKIQPKYVSDPNSKELKAYQDSLSLYNKGEIGKKQYDKFAKNLNLETWESNKAYSPDQKIQPIKTKGFVWPSSQDEDNDGRTDYMKTNDGKLVKTPSNIGSVFPKSGVSNLSYLHLYKKPVQPVVYQKQQPNPDPVNLNKERQLIFNNIPQTTSREILPQTLPIPTPVNINQGDYSYSYRDETAPSKKTTKKLNSKAELEALIDFTRKNNAGNFLNSEFGQNNGNALFNRMPEFQMGGRQVPSLEPYKAQGYVPTSNPNQLVKQTPQNTSGKKMSPKEWDIFMKSPQGMAWKAKQNQTDTVFIQPPVVKNTPIPVPFNKESYRSELIYNGNSLYGKMYYPTTKTNTQQSEGVLDTSKQDATFIKGNGYEPESAPLPLRRGQVDTLFRGTRHLQNKPMLDSLMSLPRKQGGGRVSYDEWLISNPNGNEDEYADYLRNNRKMITSIPSITTPTAKPITLEESNKMLQDRIQPRYKTTNKSQFGTFNPMGFLAGALTTGIGQIVANGVNNQRQQEYIDQQNDPYSVNIPIKQASYSRGVAKGYMQEGGMTEDDDMVDFLGLLDEAPKEEPKQEQQDDSQDNSDVYRKQRKMNRYNQAMEIVNQDYKQRNRNQSQSQSYNPIGQNGVQGISEMFYDPIALNYNSKRGYKSTPFGNHATHGHFASENANVISQAKQLAKSLGLTIREDGEEDVNVDPVHSKNSYHYRKIQGNKRAAMDIQGNPTKISEFFKIAQQQFAKKYQEGGEYDVSPFELLKIIQKGYKVKHL